MYLQGLIGSLEGSLCMGFKHIKLRRIGKNILLHNNEKKTTGGDRRAGRWKEHQGTRTKFFKNDCRFKVSNLQ